MKKTGPNLRWIATIASLFALTLTTSAGQTTMLSDNKSKEIAPMPIREFDWSGFYLGVNAGWTSGEYDTGEYFNTAINNVSGIFLPGRGIVIVPGTTRPLPNLIERRVSGFTGGGQLGYNFQFRHLVIGLEGDFNGTTLEDSQSSLIQLPPTVLTGAGPFAIDRNVKTDWTSSVRLRAGFAANRFLVYATGGLGLANITVDERDSIDIPPSAEVLVTYPGTTSVPINGGASTRNVHVGYTVGAGFEYAFNDTLSMGVEYRHSDYGSEDYITGPSTYVLNLNPLTNASPARTPLVQSVNFKDDRVTLRFNIRFARFFGRP